MGYTITSLRRRPGRSALTMLGVGLATGLVIILLALSAGIQTSSTSLATASGVDLLAVSANTTLSGAEFPYIAGAHQLPSAMARADPNVVAASPWLVGSLTYGNASLYAASNSSASGSGIPSGWSPVESTSIGWIPGDNTGLEVPTVEAGTGLPSPTDLHYANGTYRGPFSSDAVIDQELATLLRASVGSVVWVSSQSVSGPHALAAWYANATAFRVVGISSPFWLLPSVTLGFFYLSELQQLEGDSSPATDYASVVLIHLTDPTTAGSDQSRLEQTFPGITVFTLANILGEVQQVVNLYRTFGTLIGAIGLVVATLFTSTVLLMSVDDHSREIALRRALGFSRAAIARLVLEEAVALSAGGLLIGLAIGWLGSAAINRFLDALVPGLPNGFSFVTFDLALLGTAIGLVLGLGLLASILPLARAMSFPVAEELRAP